MSEIKQNYRFAWRAVRLLEGERVMREGAHLIVRLMRPIPVGVLRAAYSSYVWSRDASCPK